MSRHSRKYNYTKRHNNKNDEEDSDEEEEMEVLVQNNHIYFWCDVDKKACLHLSLALSDVFHKYMRCTMPGEDPLPIYLHINSYGGCGNSALGVIQKMETLKQAGAHIITIIEGYAASAATLISVSGSERRIGK